MHLRLMNGVCMNAELHEVQGGGIRWNVSSDSRRERLVILIIINKTFPILFFPSFRLFLFFLLLQFLTEHLMYIFFHSFFHLIIFTILSINLVIWTPWTNLFIILILVLVLSALCWFISFKYITYFTLFLCFEHTVFRV